MSNNSIHQLRVYLKYLNFLAPAILQNGSEEEKLILEQKIAEIETQIANTSID